MCAKPADPIVSTVACSHIADIGTVSRNNRNFSRRKEMMMFVRYAVTGAINTILTLLIIYFTKGIMGINPWLANALGYGAGFVNSFMWNKLWVFRSHRGVMREALQFCIGFAVCYLLQLCVTWTLTAFTPLGSMEFSIAGIAFSGYGLATIIGMGFYTLANFAFNRGVTFRQKTNSSM